MRRKEKEIKDREEIEDILRRGEVMRLALVDGDEPYIVPINYGFQDNSIYFHSAPAGRKVEILKKSDRVCFEVDVDYELVPKEIACSWSMKFKSVIGYGRVHSVEGPGEMKKGLNILLEHYTGKRFEIPDKKLEDILVLRIDIERMTGKRSG